MTNEGFNRLATLFLADIKHIEYKKDGVVFTKTISESKITHNEITVTIDIPDTENGVFNNFKVISTTGITYSYRDISFTKTQDGLKIDIPFIIVNG